MVRSPTSVPFEPSLTGSFQSLARPVTQLLREGAGWAPKRIHEATIDQGQWQEHGLDSGASWSSPAVTCGQGSSQGPWGGPWSTRWGGPSSAGASKHTICKQPEKDRCQDLACVLLQQLYYFPPATPPPPTVLKEGWWVHALGLHQGTKCFGHMVDTLSWDAGKSLCLFLLPEALDCHALAGHPPSVANLKVKHGPQSVQRG